MISRVKSAFLFELYLWKNKRILAVFLLSLINVLKFTAPLARVIGMLRIRTSPWLFPHFLSNPFNIMIFLLGVCILFSNAPFIDNLTYFELARSDRKSWFMGKVLYIFIASLAYVGLNLLLIYLLLITKTSFMLDWGKLIKTLSVAGAEIGYFEISSYIVSQYSSISAMGLSVAMAIGQCVLIGMAMFFLSLKGRDNKIAMLVSLAYTFAPSFLIAFGIETEYKFLPAMWLNLNTFDRLGLSSKPKVQSALILLLIAIFILILFGYRAFKGKEIYPYSDLY